MIAALVFGAGAYLLVTLAAALAVHRFPRRPVSEVPDWGRLEDTRLAGPGGGKLEVWRVTPEGPTRGTVVLVHGWGRNRDRMTGRARLFGQLGFTTVLFSARDHGGSSPYGFMNALEFAKDIAVVMAWVGEPVILYGHSAGAGGAIIAAHRQSDGVTMLFLEGCYARTREALLGLYRWFNPLFGVLCGPPVLVWLRLFYGVDLDSVSPVRLAPDLTMPAMLVHGKGDRRFPVAYAHELKAAFGSDRAELFVAPDAGHSDSSLQPGYGKAVAAFVERHCAVAFPAGGTPSGGEGR